jgi:hypothetical protein
MLPLQVLIGYNHYFPAIVRLEELISMNMEVVAALPLSARGAFQLLWAALAAVGVLAFRFSFFRAFVLQGRLRSRAAVAQLPGLALLRLEVPKKLWTWFYLVGALHSAAVLCAVAFADSHPVVQLALQALQSTHSRVQVQRDTVVFLALFAVHVTRRFLESALVTQFGQAKMHVGVFFVGCVHYIAATLSALTDPDAVTPREDSERRRVLMALGVALYAVASYHQSVCNRLIATQKRANGMQYVVPRGDWFDHVRCPLYTTDILLYVAFILVTGGTNTMLYLTLAWVLVNQTLLAKFSADWGNAKFRDAKLPMWKLVPYLW